jgi:ArsR family transcriptional regulator, lead/cadmium/zinc/bismuth-responsive transcriptional repressor
MGNVCIALDDKHQKDIINYIPSKEVLDKLASYFQAYSDPTRIKILSALSITSLCVNDLSILLNINQTTISHQLKLLRTLGMVSYKREGKIIFYSISNHYISEIMMNGVDYIM